MAASHTYNGNGHTVTIVDPSNISRDECLALARCGAEEWNKWRDEFPGEPIRDVNRALLADIDFRQEDIDFSGFRFDGVDFSGAKFGWRQKFRHCRFGRANFAKTIFENTCVFEGSTFSTSDFQDAHFKGTARFSSTLLGGTTRFQGCTFHKESFFSGACSTGDVHFDNSTFLKATCFSGAIFLNEANFIFCNFQGDAFFEARSTLNLQKTFQNPPYSNSWNEIEKLLQKYGGSPAQFRDVNFDGAVFGGRASFRSREFTGRTSFDIGRKLRDSRTKLIDGKEVLEEIYDRRPAQFAKPPEFFDCELCQQVSFDHARFPTPAGEPESARCYRVLKQAFATHQATREEQRFFKLEMAEEAMAATGWKRWLYRAHESTSDFGFSVSRPLIKLLFLPGLGALGLYLFCMAAIRPELWSAPLAAQPKLASQWLQFTLINLSPLPDSGALRILRSDLFGTSGPAALAATAVEILQKLLAFTGYFLSGLALRNLFKMK